MLNHMTGLFKAKIPLPGSNEAFTGAEKSEIKSGRTLAAYLAAGIARNIPNSTQTA